MAGNADLQRKLNQGVEAAKAGDRTTARRLLEEVVAADDRNEMAWIWLATVATGASQRREYLRKVIAINPRNQRAREALAALGEDTTAPAAPVTGGSLSSRTQGLSPQDQLRRGDVIARRSQRGSSTGLIFIIAAVALLLTGIGIILFGSDIFNQTPAPIPTNTPPPFVAVVETQEPTDTPQPLPSNTPVPIDQITRSAATLPPTPTPSFTPTATPTLFVTQPFEVTEFEIVYVSHDLAVPEPQVLMLRVGEADGLILERARDITIAPDDFTIAFVRDVVSEDGSTRTPEIFISTLADPENARQLTTLGASDTSHPSFSPDGSRLVFSSSNGGIAPDLWVISIDGGRPTQITNTPEGEREPAWSPTGTSIVYTSDLLTPGSTEIFILTVTAAGDPLGSPIQATNANRNSYSPSWSMDGSTIVFASDRTGDGDIWTMDAQGNNELLVTVDDGGAEDREPGFSPDGRWIVFISNREDGNFQTYVMRTNGTNTRRVTFNERVDLAAMFRPRKLQ